MLGAKELLGALDGQLLDVVDECDALVVASTRVALRVLDVEMRRQALQDGPRRVVLARDEVQRAGVALAIALDERVDLGVSGLERRRGPRRDGHAATVYF